MDDNRELVEVVRSHLETQAFEVRVAHTASDGERLFIDGAWDAILVDLLLPDRTGHRLLARLAKRRPLPPVFIMSGVFRGAKAREQIEAVTPVAGWFEKPFDFRVLSDAVCRVLDVPFKNRAVRTPAVDQALKTFEAIEARIPAPRKMSDETAVGLIWDQNTRVSSSGVNAGVGSSVRGLDPFRDPRSGFGRSAMPMADNLASGLRTELRSGDLRFVPAARLFGAFHVANETGEVAFEGQGRRQIVYFESGRPVFARSNRPEDRLSVLVAEELGLDPQQVEAATVEARTHGRSFPALIVDRGWTDLGGLERLMRQQMQRMLLDLFRWTDGQYVIRFRARPDLPRVDLPEDTAQLVLNGIRDQFPLSRLQELLPNYLRPIPAPNPPFPLFGLPIRDAEASMLLRVTGSRTVLELIEQAPDGLDEREVRAILYGLLALGVLVLGIPRSTGADSVVGASVA